MATQDGKTADKAAGLNIEVINQVGDFTSAFESAAKCFGDQINDAVWTAMNPGWDTPEGKAAGAARLAARWRSTTTNKDGNPNTVFLKATLPDPQRPDQRILVGFAIWAQLSVVEGYGDKPSTDLSRSVDLEVLYPGNPAEQRFLSQAYSSLLKQRVETVRLKEGAHPPATFVLDLCVVDPAFQRRGIALKLVQWGVEEAERRDGLEATTEASAMGRHVYIKLGFKPVADVEYKVDEDVIKGRTLPPNLFMRTGGVAY
ncbi:putative gnat family acetyltransferase [Diaporthe ampelina]|uniref:Putative gnat family acetyltransferase n=1 Tax=Diaporthe ampelina TaxID=1214573 RepID=A0A0G2HX00_9PEZI|nr:putative gnat family acetyltransferase [Diaporthe ampelina]